MAVRWATRGVTGGDAGAVAAVAATVGIAGVCWIVVARQMAGMDMGAATRLGTFASFTALWVAMMAAMMLPGAAPAVLRRARAGGGARSVPLFVASYLAVWTVVGVAVYGVYRPHGTLAAGAIVTAVGLYELTPLKHRFRARCRATRGSGFAYGLSCAGASIGLMLVPVALGVMSVTWMVVAAALMLAQKLLPPRPAIDVPVALAVTALGVLIIAAPASVPGLMPSV